MQVYSIQGVLLRGYGFRHFVCMVEGRKDFGHMVVSNFRVALGCAFWVPRSYNRRFGSLTQSIKPQPQAAQAVVHEPTRRTNYHGMGN